MLISSRVAMLYTISADGEWCRSGLIFLSVSTIPERPVLRICDKGPGMATATCEYVYA